MGFRIGRKVGKKSFISVGKSGSYFSTWIGGYRISKFTPYKSTPKEKEPTPYMGTKPKDLSGAVNELGETYSEYKQRKLAEYRAEHPVEEETVSTAKWWVMGLIVLIVITFVDLWIN